MQSALPLFLLVMLATGLSPAQAASHPGPEVSPPASEGVLPDSPSASLPDAPSAALAAPQQNDAQLPRSFHPTWSVDRSRVRDKLSYGFASLGSPRNLAEALLLAGIPNLPSAPTQPVAPSTITIDAVVTYGKQMDAWGHAMDTWRRSSENVLRYQGNRLGVGLATAETRQVLSNLALPLALHQEARYRPAPIDATLDARLATAAASIVVTHDDHGRLVPNYSKLIGTVGAGLIGENIYANQFNAPEFNSSHFLVKYVGYSLAGDLATNAAHELLRASIEQDVEVYTLHGRATEDSYYPLSAGAKFIYWIRSTYAPRNFVEAFLIAEVPLIGSQPKEPNFGVIKNAQQALLFDQEFVAYGNAIQDWRRELENNVRYHEHRLIGGFAAAETQMTLQNMAVPMLLGVDPRYIPLGRGYGAGTRLGHTFKSLVTARTDSGGRTVNLPVLVGTVGGGLMAQRLYYPTLGTPKLESNAFLMEMIGINFGLDVIGNIRNEFSRHRGY